MKIVVCVKQVNEEINPFDACALECALRIENAEVTVISMGIPQVSKLLTSLTRFGIHRAILLTDPAFAGSDTLATSYVLAQAIRKLNPDLVFCGRQSIDGDTAQVGPSLSQMLGFSLITNVMEIKSIVEESKPKGSKITCLSRMGEESVSLPALITIERINTLRFPSIRAKSKKVEIWNSKDINADVTKCGLTGSPTRVLKTYECNIGKRKCKFIQPNELINLINDLKKQSRSEIRQEPCKSRLDEVWIVGDELKEIALCIAEKVKVIERQAAVSIAELAKEHKPKVILWPSDLWGRRNAPIVAAILETGLCADCTSLETDGERLFMYRPAYGGSLMAKVECRTYPKMATVRTITEMPNQIIIAGGKGAREDFNLLEELTGKIGATLGASRGLVDMGIASYEMQIGLTGKSVNPKIYIACGISGAVQHTCAIEQAGTVIAINTDRNARIFEYADYGVIGDIREVLRNICHS
jgi:electron transfer flavoprotein alpha subunit